MIRLANKFDLDACVEMMRQYAAESGIPALMAAENHDEQHIRDLLISLMAGRGFILIDSEHRGMLAAMVCRNFWCPKVLELREAAWWVHPDHRNKTLGGRLFAVFNAQAKRMLDDGHVQVAFLSLLESSSVKSLPDFVKVDSTYMKV